MTLAERRPPVSLTGQDPAGYQPHTLHSPQRPYPETNCYADVIVELLHARRLEPLAAFGHLVRLDFEGDQWTFFKPPAEDLQLLYGVDIHEMQPYRPLPVQIGEQLAVGRTMIVELDAYHLPDTAATSYRREHVKSSVAADAIDPEAELLRYFHATGLHELSGEDYRGVFRTKGSDATILPPYAELVRFDAGLPLDEDHLRQAAEELLARHLRRRPTDNPFERFAQGLERQLPALLGGSLDDYHAYAFATVRMAGAGFAVLGDHLRWLFGVGDESTANAIERIVDGCKALSFRLARRRPFDPSETLRELSGAYDELIVGITARMR